MRIAHAARSSARRDAGGGNGGGDNDDVDSHEEEKTIFVAIEICRFLLFFSFALSSFAFFFFREAGNALLRAMSLR